MPFAEIVGHQRQLQTVRASLENGRMHHAYLFFGPEGVGKRTIAEALAKSLHCQERRCDFCDRCPSCASIRDRNHPDVYIVEPQTGKKEISIRQVRELTEKMFLRSFSGRMKIALIDPAELMNYHAQNALLKTIEEPPENSTLVLITRNSGALLPTLLSRCLRISFGLLPITEASHFLALRRGLTSAQSRLLAALTMGSIGQALAWSEGQVQDERKESIERYCALSESDYRTALAFAEELASDREKCFRVLQWIEGWNRDVLALQVTDTNSLIRNVDLVESLRKQAFSGRAEQTLAVLSELSRVVDALQKNYNRRMVLENFFVRLLRRDAPQGTEVANSRG
jgi:DNA polymerase III subunit delta'